MSGPLASNIDLKFGHAVNSLSPHSINAPNRGTIVVFAKGGCGGWGGNGGKGGDGGSGGHGGRGGDGHDGKDASPGHDGGQNSHRTRFMLSSESHTIYAISGNGGNGGNGGAGGNGGSGADGGSPAPGGLAGRGGNVVVSTRDPKLLMLVECDVRGGFGGRGGLGGIRGSAGNGGIGGHAGKGGRAGHGGKEVTERRENKTVTIHKAGRSGQSGSSGSSGHNGSSGSSGRGSENYHNLTSAPDGSVSYIILDSNGATVEQASERFNLTVTTRCAHSIAIFTPRTLHCVQRNRGHTKYHPNIRHLALILIFANFSFMPIHSTYEHAFQLIHLHCFAFR